MFVGKKKFYKWAFKNIDFVTFLELIFFLFHLRGGIEIGQQMDDLKTAMIFCFNGVDNWI